MNKNILGKQVALLRDRFGYTQEDLASKIGVSKQTISNWETGLKSPRMGAIEKMAELFNVSKGFIIDGSDDTKERLLPIFDQLSMENKNRVINYSIELLKNQQPTVTELPSRKNSNVSAEIPTLAAHRVDENEISSPEEIKRLHSFLDELDRKYDEKNKNFKD